MAQQGAAECLHAKHCSSKEADEAAKSCSQSLYNPSACEKIDVTTQLKPSYKIEVRTLHHGRGCGCEKI